MKFAELSNIQKFHAVTYGTMIGKNEVTIAEIDAVYEELKEKKKAGEFSLPAGIKGGLYPMWMIKSDNRISKGVFGIPEASDEELKEFNSIKDIAPVKVTKVTKITEDAEGNTTVKTNVSKKSATKTRAIKETKVTIVEDMNEEELDKLLKAEGVTT